MLIKYIALLKAIRPSDGDVKPGGYLVTLREEKAMRRYRVSAAPSFSSSSHPYLNFLQYTIQILVPHVMWSAQAERESKIDHIRRIYPPSTEIEARNCAVGWHWNTHTHIHTHTYRHFWDLLRKSNEILFLIKTLKI